MEELELDLKASYRSRLKRWIQKSSLPLYTVLLLLTSVGNSLYFKKMTSSMPNYIFFLTQISTVFYLPFFGLLAGKALLGNASKTMRQFAIMGMFDGLNGVLMLLGGSHTSGTMQAMLGQAVIPITVIVSITLLGKHFHFLQYTGAATITFGLILAKLASGGAQAGADIPLYNAVFIAGQIPSAFSQCYKEVAFRGADGDLDVNVLQFWVVVFQMMMNFAALPVYSLPMLGPQQVPMADMWEETKNGASCLFLMQDHVVENCGGFEQKPCDVCADALSPVLSYMAFNILFNIFTVLVIKHGSATLSFLVATLRMPLTSLAFSSTLLVGHDAVQPTFSDFVSLLVILSGLGFYRTGGKMLKRQMEKTSAAALSSPSTWLLSDSPSRSSSSKLGSLTRRVTGWKFVPLFVTGSNPQPVFLYVPPPTVQARSPQRLRNDLIHRLGAASPLHSPSFRHRSPTHSPGRSSPPSPRSPRMEDGSDDPCQVTNEFVLSGA
jgi:drug/metabolite transporter (DMT)-like permease